jgi:hypothetical protein
MNAFRTYFWPVFAIGSAVGLVGGFIGFRRHSRLIVAAAALAALAGAGLWHGPLGAADRFSARVEKDVARTLTYYEMTQVQAGLHRNLLTRRVMMSGTANDFQRNELVRLMEDIPGVSRATWTQSAGLPLIAEALLTAFLGFLLGLLLSYGIELRRRYNAQWKW